MKDFLGNTFEVGDEVVYMQINYRNFKRGKVTKESPKTCLIGRARQFHDQVIKVRLEESDGTT